MVYGEYLFLQKIFIVNLAPYKDAFLEYLKAEIIKDEPRNLYLPIEYILELGGKRLRPILVLIGYNLFRDDYDQAMEAALCLEMFHNFTLIHDDIMDKADLRRGEETVHKKWNINTGILSGDALMILSYKRLEYYKGEKYMHLMSLFNEVALEVCEGQQMDIDFETKALVSLDEYFKMISYKTAVLIGCALKMGAIIASAEESDQESMYQFGLNLGIAFQLQDDYLDSFGSEDFGKKIGGDIVENKKTFLYITTLEKADNLDREKLLKLFANDIEPALKIKEVKQLYRKYKADALLEEEIEKFTFDAFKNVEALSMDASKKQVLIDFGNKLMKRKN